MESKLNAIKVHGVIYKYYSKMIKTNITIAQMHHKYVVID